MECDLRVYPALADHYHDCQVTIAQLARVYGAQYTGAKEYASHTTLIAAQWTSGPVKWLIREPNGQRAPFLKDLSGPTFGYHYECNYNKS